MIEGGDKEVTSSQRAADIIRFGGLAFPLVLSINAWLIGSRIVNSSVYAGPVVAGAILLPWAILGTYQFVAPSRNQLPNMVHILLYHLFASAYVLFISGISTPFIGVWAILILASHIYFKRSGALFSVSVLLSTLAIALSRSFSGTSGVNDILTTVITLIVGFITVAVWSANGIDNQELAASKAHAALERDRIMTIVNNLADAILSIDHTGAIQVYNAATLGLLDTNINIGGKRIDSVLKLTDSAGHPFNIRKACSIARGVVARDDLTATISDETLRLSVIYSPIRSASSSESASAGQDGYILILRDITKQKNLEEERDEFISVVSHELRTPLTIAEGSLSNLALMAERGNMPQQTILQNIAMAHDQMIYLSRMVNDLSTLSRAERGTADASETIDVEALIHELYNEYAPDAEKKQLRLDLDLQPQLGTVSASRLYLRELIQNFVTNAIKYTKEGNILIAVTRTDDHVTFAVKDSGIGISKSDQARIFEKFYRSEDYRTRETGGTGLGLYVAAKLARKLQTRITVNSRLNHGSTFSFDLPITADDA